MRSIVTTSFALALASLGSAAHAQLSELYLNQHDNGSGNIYVVQGGAIVRSWSAERGSLFVNAGTVRTAGNGGGAGAEYTLAGVPTGVTFPTPGTAGMHNDDSTTDGSFAYGMDYISQNVIRFNLDWSNPTSLFPVSDDSDGITWDYTDNTFWTVGWTTPRINHYSSTGTLLGSFSALESSHVGLAIDPADHTLWLSHWNTNQIDQYSVTGTYLQSLVIPGLPTDIAGAEFAVPAPGAAALLGLGGLMASRRRRA